MNSIMQYDEFISILNDNIFGKSKADLLEKIKANPYRYMGIFRPTKPIGKITQNLLQSHEIRFGSAFEIIISKYFKLMGYEILDNKIIDKDANINLQMDHLVKKNNKYYFVEQKVRDDHDSSKKRGQISNFEHKISQLVTIYPEKDLIAIMYFIDPSLIKNKSYYLKELKAIEKDYNVEAHLFYGKDFYDFIKAPNVWDEINEYLIKWRASIPDLPIVNFDLDSNDTFEEIKDLNPSIYNYLFSNDKIYEQIIKTIFPTGETVKLLLKYFSSKNATIYKTIVKKLTKMIST